jgi:DNA-binding CsgD family transcriptional regulator
MGGSVTQGRSSSSPLGAADLAAGPPRRPRGRTSSPLLIGRSAELSRVVATVSALPAVVVVEGEAGIGKTRLLGELRALPKVRSLRFVVGGCRLVREPFPLGPVVDALRGRARDIDTEQLSPVAGALRPLLPELVDVLPPVPEPLDDRVAERHRVYRGLADVLATLQPAVLVLEDVHWADLQTVEFVRYLLADPLPGLAVVLTFRGEEVDPEVRAVTARLAASVSHCHVVLEPLDPAQTGAMAAAILDLDGVSEAFAAYLCERASGLPFAIEELLAVLRARGSLVRRSGSWARKALDELAVPAGIRDSVVERVSRMSPHARSVVEAVATLQEPMPLDVVVETCGVPSNRAVSALEEAMASGLLGEQDEAVGFRHILAAQAVYESLVLPRRRELHSRAASAVEAVHPVPLGQLAHHLRHAGRVEEWAVGAERAADQALELGHEDEAVRLLDDVLRTATLEPDYHGRLAVKLSRAALEAGRSADVIQLVTDVLDDVQLASTVRGELRFWLAMLTHSAGQDPVRPHQLWSAAVEDLSDRPDLRAWAMVNLGMPIVPGMALSEHLGWLHEARRTLPQVDDPELEVFLLGKTAMMLIAVGDPEWRGLVDRFENLTDGMPRSRLQVSAYHSAGRDACCAGQHELSERLLTTALKGAAACASPRPALYVRSAQVLLNYCSGKWAGLDDEVPLVLDELSGGVSPFHNDAFVAAGCLALARGSFDEAEHQLADAIRRAFVEGMDTLPLPTAAMVRLALATGDPATAVAGVERFLAALDAKPIWPPAARAVPTMVEALVAAGRADEAHSLVARFDRAVRGLDAPLAPAALAYANGVLDAGARRWRTAFAHFLAASERYEQLLCPYEAAQSREQAAGCLFEVAEGQRAAEVLRAAVVTYERLGARWDLDRAAGLARTHDVGLPARHRGGTRGYGARLSPREQEVAELAGVGQTNKEIAEKLYVSPSTVKKHLTAAMRKLHVSSRTALAHRLAVGEPDRASTNGPDGP